MNDGAGAGRASAPPLVVMEGVSKRFPGVLANDDVSLELRAGEVHALIGENGAGKSTLMRVLYGVYPPDGGRIFVRGEEVKIASPRDAIALGIGMVHQHFVLVDPFTVAENIILGHEGGRHPRPGGLRSAGLPSSPTPTASRSTPRPSVEDLSVGEEQRVEILKALYRGVDILILDEPTAVLTPAETPSCSTTSGGCVTTARRSCSSATSSMRCSRSPIASPCSDAGPWSGRPPRPRRRRRSSPR